MTKYCFISDYYMGEIFNDDDFVSNFVDGFNKIFLKGTIVGTNEMNILFCVDEIINFTLDEHSKPKIGDIIKLEWERSYNKKYWIIGNTQFGTDMSVLCNAQYYDQKCIEHKFNDFIKSLYELQINNDNEKTYLINSLEEFIKHMNENNIFSSVNFAKHTTLGEIKEQLDVYYDPSPMSKDSIMKKDNIITQIFNNKNISYLPWLIRVELNKGKMLEKKISILDITIEFDKWWENKINDNNLIKEEKKIINNIRQLIILSNSDNDRVPIIHIRFSVNDNFQLNILSKIIEYLNDSFKIENITHLQT